MFSVFLTQSGGILGPIAKGLGWILNVIFEFLVHFGIGNAGLCIIIFTFIVNALMIPLNIKQQKFTKMSSIMNPELQKIQSKYKGKRDETSMQKMNMETQAVYEKYGASPTAGCLPMLITFPIMFALYRVIYNIPAYVGSIKALYSNIAVALQGTDYVSTMSDFASNMAGRVNTSNWEELTAANPSITVNHLIDIMKNFKAADWSALASNSNFATIKDTIQVNADKIMSINNFGFGLNIAEAPMTQILSSANSWGVRIAYLLIPILAVVTQVLQTKMLMTKQPNQNSGNETMDATMKSMNTMMPLISGFFCLSLPVGVGIYWIAGAVFRTVQQIFVNQYMDKVGIEAIIEKNVEKAKKRREKRGESLKNLDNLARQRTSTMGDKAKVNVNRNAKTANDYEKKNVSYKAGSISANAHLLDRNKEEK